MKTIYLAGPMKGLSFEQANKWRKDFLMRCPQWLGTLSPTRGSCHIKLKESLGDEEIANSYENHPMTSTVGINVRDFNDVRRCDMLVANINDMHSKSIGTIMEIAWARSFNIPVVLILPEDFPEDHPYNHSMLLYGVLTVKTLESAVDIAVDMLGTDKQISEFHNNK